MRKDVAEFTTFMNRSRCWHTDVTRHTAWRRKTAKQLAHAADVLAHFGVHLRVSAFEIHVRDHRRPTVPWSGKKDHVGVVFVDQPIQMRVDQTQAGRRSPVAEQTRLYVLGLQWLARQRIFL